MSRAGTCKHCYAIQELWRIKIHPQPHEARETHVVMPEGEYTCQWLDRFEKLPPPMQRQNGAMGIRKADCDVCELYDPVATLENLLSK